MTDNAKTDLTIHRVISREDARARELKHYYTGKPCKYGHVAMRKVSTGVCVECASAYAAAVYRERKDNNPEGVRAQVNAAVKRHYNANRDAILERKRLHYLANAETLKAKARERRRANRIRKSQEQTHAAAQ